MAGAVLSAGERAYCLRQMRWQLNSAVHRRLNALLLLDEGRTAERVAQALYIDAQTVREHQRRYLSDGCAGLERLEYAGQAPAAELERRIYLSAKEVCGFVGAGLGVSCTPHAMAKLLVRLGFVWKRPKRVPAKADPEAQRAFLAETLAPLMAQAEADPDHAQAEQQRIRFIGIEHQRWQEEAGG